MIRAAALVGLLASWPASTQEALSTRVMTAVREALAAALPYPEADAKGAVPVNDSTEALWMVRYPAAGEKLTIEVSANPLNEVVQLRATRAMAQIDLNIQAAQRRATMQYENAVAEAKRTGRSQDVDGVTLSDEGIAGERIDAESHVTIDVLFNERDYRFGVPGAQEPTRLPAFTYPNGVALMVPAHPYRGDGGAERFAESQRLVFMGRIGEPRVSKQPDDVWNVTAAAIPQTTTGLHGLVLRIRGNNELVTEIVAKTDWARLLELLK